MAKTRETESGASEVVTNPVDGSTLFVVLLLAKPRPRDGRSAGKGGEIKVTLETDPGDEIEEGTLIELIKSAVFEHLARELTTHNTQRKGVIGGAGAGGESARDPQV